MEEIDTSSESPKHINRKTVRIKEVHHSTRGFTTATQLTISEMGENIYMKMVVCSYEKSIAA